MYSVVLMMAMSGASEAPDCGCLARLFCCRERYYSSCYGCTGCTGCYGSYVGCYGCNGGCYGGYVLHHHSYGCYGCSGIPDCGCFGTVVVPPVVQPTPPPPVTKPVPDLPMPGTRLNRVPGSILVSVPSDAVLYFDGVRMSVNSGSRRFTTPPLESGRTYYYTVRAEVAQGGQTVFTTERVLVRSGQEAQVSFDLTPAGTLTAHQD